MHNSVHFSKPILNHNFPNLFCELGHRFSEGDFGLVKRKVPSRFDLFEMLNTRSFLRELLFVSGYNFIFFFLACDVLHPQVEIGDAEVLLP